jgi:hypothetical protein
MNTPKFTAEVSLDRKTRYYVSLRRTELMDSGPPVGPASFAALGRFPFPFPGPGDVCSACVNDCIRRGGNSFSCRNLCSFVCH